MNRQYLSTTKDLSRLLFFKKRRKVFLSCFFCFVPDASEYMVATRPSVGGDVPDAPGRHKEVVAAGRAVEDVSPYRWTDCIL